MWIKVEIGLKEWISSGGNNIIIDIKKLNYRMTSKFSLIE